MASLSDLGLSDYEVRVYRALLESGPATAKELSRTSGVPMGRIYDVLNGIEAQHLVRSQTASRPKKYVAVEPEAALDRLLEAKTRELAERADQYESIVDELKRELDAPKPVGDEEFWTAALGSEDAIDLLLERIDAADEQVAMIASTPAAGFDLEALSDRIADRMAAARDRGVEVRILVSRELARSIPERVAARYDQLVREPGFAVHISDDGVQGSFTVVDETEVCIEVPNPLDPGEAFALIDLMDPSFAGDVHAEFEPRWAAATPLQPRSDSQRNS